MFGVGVLLFGLGAATFGTSYLVEATGDAVDDTGNGALKLAAAGACGVGVYYAWGRL